MTALTATEADLIGAKHNISLLQDMIELGAQLAREAAQKVLQPPPPDQAPSRARTPDYSQVFTRMWSAIRQAISLQLKLGTSAPAAVPASAKPAASQPKPDTRRETIIRVLGIVTAARPDRVKLRRHALHMLDRELAKDPDGKKSASDLVTTICAAFRIPLDPKTMPAELLDILCSPDRRSAPPMAA